MSYTNAPARGLNVIVGGAFGATRGEAVSSRTNTLIGGVYLVLGLIGLFILSSDVNILALNTVDNILHFGSAAVLLGVGLTATRRAGARV